MKSNRPISAKSRPSSASSSLRSSEVIRVTSSSNPGKRIEDNTKHFKSMLMQKPLPSQAVVSAAHDDTFGDLAAIIRVDRWGVRTDHLCVHRRQWSEHDIRQRLHGMRPGSCDHTSAAITARQQLAAFSRQHNAEEMDLDDPEDAAVVAAEAEAIRKAEALGQKTKVQPQRPRSRGAVKAFKVSVASGESIALKYIVALERLIHCAKSVPAVSLRRLMTMLERQEGESMVRAGHEAFRAIRQAVFKDKATSPSTIPNNATPVNGVSPDGSIPSLPTSPNAVSSAKQQLGAGLSKLEAAAVYEALDIFHDGYIALKPSLAALTYVGGARSATDFVAFVFAALTAHNAITTATDVISITRYARESVAGQRARALTLSSLGRGTEVAMHAAARLRNGIAAPDDSVIVRQLEQLQFILFNAEREAVGWQEAVELMAARAESLDVIYPLALEFVTPQPKSR